MSHILLNISAKHLQQRQPSTETPIFIEVVASGNGEAIARGPTAERKVTERSGSIGDTYNRSRSIIKRSGFATKSIDFGDVGEGSV